MGVNSEVRRVVGTWEASREVQSEKQHSWQGFIILKTLSISVIGINLWIIGGDQENQRNIEVVFECTSSSSSPVSFGELASQTLAVEVVTMSSPNSIFSIYIHINYGERNIHFKIWLRWIKNLE